MRVLVTGSGGFVASHFVEHVLARTDWDVVGIDSFRHRGDSLRLANSSKYRVFCHDLTAPVSQQMAHQIGTVDYIVNFAAESHVERSIHEPRHFIENNAAIAVTMLEYARLVQPKKFIQISTDEVYGAAPGNVCHKEWSTIIPSNPYSASKACQEAIAISYWRTYGVPLVITNTMNMFGERQDTEKFIPMLIKRIQNGQDVTVHGNPEQIGSRFYLHARNHADALLFLLQDHHPSEYKDGDETILPSRFNIVGEVEIDNLELAKLVASILSKPLHYQLVDFHAARPGHDRRYALDGHKLGSLGWKSPFGFKESLEKTIKWTLDNPAWLL